MAHSIRTDSPKILMQHEIKAMSADKFRVGHPAYHDCNHAKYHKGYQSALNDLLSRGVSMTEAHKVLKKALSGSFVCAHPQNSFGLVIEVIYYD